MCLPLHWRIDAHWCNGALVHWCIGALAHWCIGALVHWRFGALPYGSLARLSEGRPSGDRSQEPWVTQEPVGITMPPLQRRVEEVDAPLRHACQCSR
jgi:hypothetical protein